MAFIPLIKARFAWNLEYPTTEFCQKQNNIGVPDAQMELEQEVAVPPIDSPPLDTILS
jgi:hypothetical protein